MAEFFRHQGWHFALADVTAYAEQESGVLVEFTRRSPVTLTGDDAADFLALVRSRHQTVNKGPASVPAKKEK